MHHFFLKVHFILFLFLVTTAEQRVSAQSYHKMLTEEGWYLQNDRERNLNKKPLEYIGWSDDANDSLVRMFDDEDAVIAFQSKGYWGLLDDRYKVSMKPQRWTSFEYPNQGRSIVSEGESENKSYGIIKLNGEVVIVPVYNQMSWISEKRLLIGQGKNDVKYGVVGLDGEEIIPTEYKQIRLLQEDIFIAMDDQNLWSFYSLDGMPLLDTSVDTYQDDTTNHVVLFHQYGRWGMISHQEEAFATAIEHDTTYYITPLRFKEIKNTDSTFEYTPFKHWQWADLDGKIKGELYADTVFNIGEDRYAFKTANWGMADRSGKVWDYQQYDTYSDFEKGLAIVTKGEKCGLINQEGEVVVPLNSKKIQVECSDHIRLTFEDGREDLYDFQAINVTEGKYGKIGSWSSGRYLVRKEGKYGYLDKSLQEVIPFQFEAGEDFIGDYAVVKYQGYYGVINKEGEWVIFPWIDYLEGVKEGLFIYQDNGYWGTIDTQGIEMFRNDNGKVVRTHPEGYVLFESKKKFGFLDKNGEILLPAIYSTIEWPDKEGVIHLKYGRQKYFKQLGEEGIPSPRYYGDFKSFDAPSDGYARVKYQGRYGFIDDVGRMRIACQYEDVKDFSEGWAPFMIAGYWGYLDKAENIVLQPKYQDAFPYKNGRAVVKKKGKYGLIDRYEHQILAYKYDRIQQASTGNWYVWEKGDRMGVYEPSGLKGIYGRYDEVVDLGNGVVFTRNDKLWGIDQIDGLSIFLPQFKQVHWCEKDELVLIEK